MSIIYQVNADLDAILAKVERGEHPGLRVYQAEDKLALWTHAITDGKDYLWPEGKHMALTWGRSDGAAILNKLGVRYRILD